MKLVLATAAVIGMMLAAILLVGGQSQSAVAGPAVTDTRAPTGHPNCKGGQDEGDDGDPGGSNDSEDGDNNDSDDPPGFPTITTDAVAVSDDGGRVWDGFDHDIESPDDCTGSRLGGETGTPSPSPTPTPSPTPDPGSLAASDANCDGGTNASDALSVVLFVSGASRGCTGTTNGLVVFGDASCNGSVDALDAAQILRESAALVSSTC